MGESYKKCGCECAEMSLIRSGSNGRSLYEMVRNVGLDSLLSSLVVPVTLFAPNNTAFSKMEDTEVGRTFLDPRTENQNKFQKVSN